MTIASKLASLKVLGERPVLYVGEIGRVNVFRNRTLVEANLYKYGITSNAYRRIAYSHMKNFEYFDLKVLRETMRNKAVEKMLTHTLKREQLHIKMDLKGHVHRELFYLTDPVSQLDWFQNLLDDLIIKAERHP